MSSDLAQLVQLGYVAGAHGIGGALKIKLFNPGSTALGPGVRVLLSGRAGVDPEPFEVERGAAKPGTDQTRLQLVGIATREAADQLRGRELWIARTELPALAEDEFYLADLIGLEVVRQRADASFESLGTIIGVTSNTAQDLFEVRRQTGSGSREWLLPAFPPFLLAIEPTRVVVDVHDELLGER